jgi:hypothetical protein
MTQQLWHRCGGYRTGVIAKRAAANSLSAAAPADPHPGRPASRQPSCGRDFWQGCGKLINQPERSCNILSADSLTDIDP